LAVGYHSTIAQDQTLEKPGGVQDKVAPGDLDKLLVFSTDFVENETEDWQFTDAAAWRFMAVGQRPALSQFRKESSYQPRVRSPLHQAILKEPVVGSFELQVEVRSTHVDYGHRDVCLFFGYQSPEEFYYVHLGRLTDPHCNQIFIVNKSDRKKITATTNEGTLWDDQWHSVKVVRDIQTGQIAVFFDDFENPVMTAVDKTFLSGRVGLGSFDDTADWSKLRMYELKPSTK
jgi:hypothetical protein